MSSYENAIAERRRGPIGDPTAEALYLGERSATADLQALTRAKKLRASGASREQIFEETGWFEDRGRWNYEVDDREFQERQPPPEKAGKYRDYYSHPEAERGYPNAIRSLQLYRYKGTIEGEGGQYDPRRGVGFVTNWPWWIRDQSGREKAALHELQHAIDNFEGMHPSSLSELLASEARAHSTDKRRGLTPAERKADPPWRAIDQTRGTLRVR